MNHRLSLSIPVVLSLGFGSALLGHAILVSSTPSVQEVVSGPDTRVQLRFNSRVDAGRSLLILITPSGEQLKLGIGKQSSPEYLEAQATGLKSGPHILRWQVLAIDGHITRGEVPFRVR